ncbi:uncharacterized protein HKW66_Vig0077980 [Vigna angularis]|uniref:Uncharacterized protein n=1 Tax=Phaseolus angularis TaxID=3914 RepID=A0A8T0K529_PHAAN|nr:uncharacterized protein HKW66_Vig0077980 [Vigna angularis]
MQNSNKRRNDVLQDDEFSTIVEYEIGDTEELHKRMYNLRPSHFTNIVVFRAKNCDEKLTEFIYILMKRSKKLQVIEIRCCKTSRYLFEILDPTFLGEEYLRGIKELKLGCCRIFGLQKSANCTPQKLSLYKGSILSIILFHTALRTKGIKVRGICTRYLQSTIKQAYFDNQPKLVVRPKPSNSRPIANGFPN